MDYLRNESEEKVYHRFLGKRAQKQGLHIDIKDSISCAKVRLACLSRYYNDAKEVSDAFDELPENEKLQLTMFLNRDGITQKPGFLLFPGPQLMEDTTNKVGMLCAFRMLLRIYQASEATYKNSQKDVVTIYVEEMRAHTSKVPDQEAFDFTKFEIIKSASDFQKAEIQ